MFSREKILYFYFSKINKEYCDINDNRKQYYHVLPKNVSALRV